MNCPPVRTNAPGIVADSVQSGVPAFGGVIGGNPMKSGDVRWVGLVGGYRLAETTPTA